MKKHNDNFRLLQLFGEGGAGAGAEGSGGATGATAAQGFAGPTGKDALSHVVYGKTETSAQDETGNATQSKDSAFEALIKGDYKDEYGKRVKAAVDSRFKASQEKLDKFDKAAPLFDMLSKKYGADANDIDAILKAVEDDDSYYEQEALENGLSVQQVKEQKKMMRENEALRRQIEEQQTRQQSDQILNQWLQDADAAKQIYPSLDFNAEIANQDFAKLLKAGIDVKTAYEVVHKDEILPNAMKVAVKETQRKISNSIASGMNRPRESAATNTASTVVKSDVSKLTYADRREIERRLARGERITF